MADITKSAPHVVEEFVLGRTADIRPSAVSALLSLAAVPVKGLYVITATVDLAALTNTVTQQLQEFSITDANHTVRVAVGDLFIPFNYAIGAGAGTLDATVALVPSKAITIDKLPVNVVNLTAAATNPGSATLTALWIKVA